MVGTYSGNFLSREARSAIDLWMNDTISRGDLENSWDIYIDEFEITSEVISNSWLSLSFASMSYLTGKIVEQYDEAFVPVLLIPLYGDEQRRGMNFSMFDTIEPELDVTPPSLYLRPFESQSSDYFLKNSLLVDSIFIDDKEYEIFYYEDKAKEDLEYFRNIRIFLKQHSQAILNKLI